MQNYSSGKFAVQVRWFHFRDVGATSCRISKVVASLIEKKCAQMKCLNVQCGRELDPERDKFCFNCGTPVIKVRDGAPESSVAEVEGGRAQRQPQEGTTEVGAECKRRKLETEQEATTEIVQDSAGKPTDTCSQPLETSQHSTVQNSSGTTMTALLKDLAMKHDKVREQESLESSALHGYAQPENNVASGETAKDAFDNCKTQLLMADKGSEQEDMSKSPNKDPEIPSAEQQSKSSPHEEQKSVSDEASLNSLEQRQNVDQKMQQAVADTARDQTKPVDQGTQQLVAATAIHHLLDKQQSGGGGESEDQAKKDQATQPAGVGTCTKNQPKVQQQNTNQELEESGEGGGSKGQAKKDQEMQQSTTGVVTRNQQDTQQKNTKQELEESGKGEGSKDQAKKDQGMQQSTTGVVTRNQQDTQQKNTKQELEESGKGEGSKDQAKKDQGMQQSTTGVATRNQQDNQQKNTKQELEQSGKGEGSKDQAKKDQGMQQSTTGVVTRNQQDNQQKNTKQELEESGKGEGSKDQAKKDQGMQQSTTGVATRNQQDTQQKNTKQELEQSGKGEGSKDQAKKDQGMQQSTTGVATRNQQDNQQKNTKQELEQSGKGGESKDLQEDPGGSEHSGEEEEEGEEEEGEEEAGATQEPEQPAGGESKKLSKKEKKRRKKEKKKNKKAQNKLQNTPEEPKSSGKAKATTLENPPKNEGNWGYFDHPQYKNKMTIVFHAILAPDYYFQRGTDRIMMRFDSEALGHWRDNVVELYPESSLKDGFILMKGKLEVPVDYVRRRVLEYKYVVFQMRENNWYGYYEYLLNQPVFTNRCMRIPEMKVNAGETWHQYDDAIFPEPTIVQRALSWTGISAFERCAHGRKLATQAMLPHWKGFCIQGDVSKDQMTAWEAIEQIQNVACCMTKTVIVNKLNCRNVPTGFEFGKILHEFLKPKIGQNASILEMGNGKKKEDEDGVSCLVSAVAIVHVFVQHKIVLDEEGLVGLLKPLVPSFDVKKKECVALEGLSKHFPKEHWRDLAESIQEMCIRLARKHSDLYHSMSAVPLIHFLTGQSKPFDKSDLSLDEPKQKSCEWWGAQGLQLTEVRNANLREDRCPSSFCQILAPLFKLDPLFKRTYLFAVPLKALGVVTSQEIFSVLDVCTTLARVMSEKKCSLSKEELDSVGISIRGLNERLQKKTTERSKPVDDDTSNKIMSCLSSCVSLVKVLLDNLSPDHLDKLCDLLRFVNGCISEVCGVDDDDAGSGLQKDRSNQVCTLIQKSLEAVQKWLKKVLRLEIACYGEAYVKPELKIWTQLFSVTWSRDNVARLWQETLEQMFNSRLEARYCIDLAELFTKDLSEYHDAVQNLISKVTFAKVEKMMQSGEKGEDVFRAALSSSQASRCGELLTMMLTKRWPQSSGNIPPSAYEIFKHVLTGHLWPCFFERFGKEPECLNVLKGDGPEKFLLAQSALDAACEELKDAVIEIKTLQLIQENSERFLHLCQILKHQGMDAICRKRLAELKAFEDERDRLTAFIRFCDILKRVDAATLYQKTQLEISKRPIGDLVYTSPSSDAASGKPCVIFFGLSERMKTMIYDVEKVGNSKFFLKLWKDHGSKALKTVAAKQPPQKQLTVEDVEELVWGPASARLASLRNSFLDGSITLREVDEHFRDFKGDYDSLEREITRMIPADEARKRNYAKEIDHRIKQIQQYHQLRQYTSAATAVLEFREAMQLKGDFTIVEDLKNQMDTSFQKRPLDSMNEDLMQVGRALSQITPEREECLQAVVNSEALVQWLRKTIKGPQELKVLVDLALISGGETDMETARITCLHSSCLGFAPLIFELQPDCGFNDLMRVCEPVWEAIKGDRRLHKKLTDTNRQLEWLKGVKESHGSVAMTSLMQAEAINARGVYVVGCLAQDEGSTNGNETLASMIRLTVPPKEGDNETKTYTLDELKDLQSKLMLIAAKASQGKEEVDAFVEVFEGILRLARVYESLCKAGEVSHLKWQETFQCRPAKVGERRLSIELNETCNRMEKCLGQWMEEVHLKRMQYFHLNHYTTQQLLCLRESLARARNGGASACDDLPLQVFNLLESVLPNVLPSTLNAAFVSSGVRVKTDRDPLRNYEAGLSFLTPDSSSSARAGVVHSPRSPTSSRAVEQFENLVSKVEEICEGRDIDAETVVVAAMAACDTVNEGDLILWCFKKGENESLVSEKFAEAKADPRFAPLLSSIGKLPSTSEDKQAMDDDQESFGDVHIDEVAGADEQPVLFDQTGDGTYLSLDELGTLLRHLSTDGPRKKKRHFPSYMKRGRPNLVLVGKDDIFATVLSLFMRDGSQPLPTHEEVFICSADTTAEEIELLWRRALGDSEGRLFCLVNADLVDYSVSQKAVEILERLLHERQYCQNEDYGLVVMCSVENEDRAYIVAALDQYRLGTAPPCFRFDELQGYLTRQFRAPANIKGTFCGSTQDWVPAADVDPERVSVRVVSSSRSGVGKSLVVRRLSEDLENSKTVINNDIVTRHLRNQDLDVPSLCITVPIHEPAVNQSAVVSALLEHAIAPTLPLSRIFHIDVSPSVVSGLDSLLFNLLVLGVLSDKQGQLWRRRPCDLYIVELTTEGHGTQHQTAQVSLRLKKVIPVPFHQLFPTIVCKTPKEVLRELQAPRDNTRQINPLFDDREFRSSYIQRAFRYLMLWGSGQNLDQAVAKEVEGDHAKCLEVLLSHCGVEDPSWAEIRHFVSFLNTQLLACEESTFCNMALVGDTLEGFRTFVVRFMILMSRDFATPSLNENRSLTLAQGEDEGEDIAPLQLRRQWENSSHPYIFFNQDHVTMTFVGFHIDVNGNLVDPDTRRVIEPNLMTRHLRTGLHVQRVDMETNYESWDKGQKIEKLCQVMGVEWPMDPDITYELTTDNLKKILAIHMRFRCGIPVVIMGETGCGKTRLIRYMCGLQAKLKDTRNMLLMKVHGGTTCKDIRRKVEQAEQMARANKDLNIDTVLFFDEANTTDALGMIKEVMVDRRIDGRRVGVGLHRLQFIAACNPYRRHTDEMIQKLESAGLGYHVKTEETEDRLGHIPLRHLVYRVHSLPASMRPLVWDFGQLKPEIEELYTRQIVNRYILQEKKIPGDQSVVKTVTSVLAASQRFMREQADECSFVSLRDVERAMCVMVWFYEHLNVLGPLMDERQDPDEESEDDEEDEESDEEEEDMLLHAEPQAIDNVTRALVLSIGVCYHARLQHREPYRRAVARKFVNPCQLPGGSRQILKEITSCQRAVLDELELGDNIARNTALSENVFMMVICIELRIPLFVVGKPGSSKSLAKTVVHDNMQGDAARSPLFKTFKQVHMASYQCSPLSTPDGIVATFRQCRKLQEGKNLDKFVSVVVLDEVGLAEDSPLMPLKTLHPLLEDGVTSSDDVIETDEKPHRVAFIGISNWALDPAKMNRGIMLSRGVPNQQELEDSAMGICSTEEHVKNLVAPLIKPLAAGYKDLYRAQSTNKKLQDSKKDEFFGLRDFYSLIKMVYSIAKDNKQIPRWPEVEHAVRRNFGGLDEIDPVEIFHRHFGRARTRRRGGAARDFSPVSLIQASLERKHCGGESRYLLILTENYAALPIIQRELLKEEDNAIVIFGSSFPKDQEYTQICRNINRIKVCMETGRTVILLNLESLYESLYDALNQYYVYFGGQKYVDLGLGSHRVKCRVDNDFRLIVIAERDVVYSKFPIPLINRLEKHYLVTLTSLTPAQARVVQELRDWVKDFSTVQIPAHEQKSPRKFTAGDAFAGFHDDTVASVVMQVCSELDEMKEDDDAADTEESWHGEVLGRSQGLLLQCAFPDAVARLPNTQLLAQAAETWIEYFTMQQHSSLAAFVRKLLTNEDPMLTKRKDEGFLVQVTTHSRLLSDNDLRDIVEASLFRSADVCRVSLQQFHTEQQFCHQIRDFFAKLGGSEGLLIVQSDSGDANANLIACARHLLSEQRLACTENHQEKFGSHPMHPVHIILVVQLPRVSGGCSNFVGFQGGKWLSVHIDELRPPTQQIPSIEFLVDRPISALFDTAPRAARENAMESDEEMAVQAEEKEEEEDMGVGVVAPSVDDKVDIISLLRSCVQAAVGRIDDDNSESRATKRIELMLNLLPENISRDADVCFATLLARHIHQLLKEKDERAGDGAFDWLRAEARSCTGVQERGTFRKALWQRIYSAVIPILAEVIAFIDRDSNLDLVNRDEGWLSQMWLVFFHSPELVRLRYEDFLSPVSGSIRERVPLLTSGREGHVFQSNFPFAVVVKEQIDDLWKGANSVAAKSNDRLDVCLRDHISNSNLADVLQVIQEEGYEESAAKRYLNDFVHMVHKPRVTQDVELISRAIISAARELHSQSNPQEPFSLDFAQIHVAHAHIQKRLSHLSQLVEAQPDVVPMLLDVIPPDEGEMVTDAVALKLCLANLEPKEAELRDRDQRLIWCNRMLCVRTAVESTMKEAHQQARESSEYGGKALAVIQECRPMWQRLSAVRLFIEHVYPSGTHTHPDDIENVFKLWKALGDDTDFTQPRTMDVIVRFLRDCSENISQRHNRFGANCTVCLEKPEDPAKMPCGHVTCLTCASTWLKRDRNCPFCKQAVPDDFTPVSSPEIKRAFAEHTDFRCRCNLFFMDLVALFCFGDSRDPVHDDVFKMLMGYVICGNNKTQAFSPFPEHGIDPTPVVRSFLLQQLLRSSDEQVQQHMSQYLRKAWGLRSEVEHILQVCLLFVQCKEDALVRDYSKVSGNPLLMIKVAQVLCKEAGGVLTAHASHKLSELDVQTLEGVAKARYALLLVAEFMFKSREEAEDMWQELEMRNGLGSLFEEARRMCYKTLSSVPRVYLLKQLARRYGVGSVQRLANKRGLEWILPPGDRAKQADDLAVDRFVVYGDCYQDIREAISRTTLSANQNELATALEKSENAVLRDVLLLLAEYREVTMCHASDTPGRQLSEQAQQCVQQFVQSSPLLSDKIRPFAAELLSNTHGAGFPGLRVTPDHNALERSLAEIVVHLAAVLQCVYQGTLIEPLRLLMEQPAGMNDAYFPAMPDDNLEEAMAGMTEGGKWYECPKGHPYYIGDCGRPVETKNCRECNMPIGGASYTLAQGNTAARRIDRTSTGHVLGNPESRPKVCAPERNLSPVVVSVLRILMHSAMVLGATRHPQEFKRLIQPAVPPGNLLPFLWQHLRCDVESLARSLGRSVDDSVLTVHMILSRITAYAAIQPAPANTDLTQKKGRRQWETQFTTAFVSPVISDLEAKVRECVGRIVADNRLGNDPLMRQLYEIDVAPEALPRHVPPTQPLLWRYRVQVTIEHLKNTFQEEMASVDTTKFPLLAKFLDQEHQLRAVRFLPDIVKLQRLLKEKFHRRIDRKEAEHLKVKEFLKKHLSDPLKSEFTALIASFKSAWNLVRMDLADQGRLRVPRDLCEMPFDNNVPLAVLLPTPVGLGICSTALVFFLTSLHNMFTQFYQNWSGGKASDLAHIPLNDVTAAHLVAFHPERDLVPLILAHCNYSLEVGKGTFVQYNWLALQRHLIDRFVKRRPLVDFEDERFAFSKDTGDDTVMASLREKLPQVSISAAVRAQILSEFRSNLNDVCDALSSIEIAFGFLSSAGGRPDMLLSEYLLRVLRMPGDAGLRSPKARQSCQLRHVVSLWKLLTQERAQLLLQRKQDPFEKIPDWCKEEMSHRQMFECSRQFRKMDVERFVSELLELILLNLKRENTGEEEMSLSEYMEWQLDNKRCDEMPGLDELPEDILLKHAVHVWYVAVRLLGDKRSPATA